MNMFKEILEFIYFLSGPALVFMAYKALEQIKVTRDIAKINSKRESFQITAQECRHYSQNIIPLLDTLDKKIEELDVQIITKSKVIITDRKIEIKPFFDYDHYDESIEQLTPYLVKASNAISDFATFFISGIADESLAYRSLGRTYCNTIKQLAPLLIPLCQNNDDDVMTLFFIWNNRNEKQAALAEKKKIEKKLKDSSDVYIKPIGT